MQITAIILQSIDGIISTGPEDNLSRGTPEDKNFFRSKTKEIGAMITGKTTFQSMPPKAFSDRTTLVMTSDPDQFQDYTNPYGKVIFFKGTPQDAVSYLQSQGIENIALIGGGNINGQFLSVGLVNEIFLTIAPKIFGKGTHTFGELTQNSSLKLLTIDKITDNEILLHYQIIK